mgnify:CR=1 FL=1
MFRNGKDVETYLGILDAVFMVSYAVVSANGCLVHYMSYHQSVHTSSMQIINYVWRYTTFV